MIYFKGLNGLRAIASLIVVVWHTSQYMSFFGVESPNIHENGMAGNAVDLFFVLSGFLITFLLLKEKELTNTISLRKFYLRRIYRIWPVYYLALALSLVFILFNIEQTPSNLYASIGLYTFLMANVAYSFNFAISTITPLWSIGVEEQFYLIWPNIIKKRTDYLSIFFFIFFGYLIIKLVIYLLFSPSSSIYYLIAHTRIDIMCIGAIGAYLVFVNSIILRFVLRKEIELLAWTIFIVSCIYEPIHVVSFLDSEINSVIYLILILNVSINKNPLIGLENKVFNSLGRMSYGMYVYHMFVIYLLSTLLLKLQIYLSPFMVFSSVAAVTIMASSISYHFFEKPILRKKMRFAVVKSANSNPEE